jgi:hypothetical protein
MQLSPEIRQLRPCSTSMSKSAHSPFRNTTILIPVLRPNGNPVLNPSKNLDWMWGMSRGKCWMNENRLRLSSAKRILLFVPTHPRTKNVPVHVEQYSLINQLLQGFILLINFQPEGIGRRCWSTIFSFLCSVHRKESTKTVNCRSHELWEVLI